LKSAWPSAADAQAWIRRCASLKGIKVRVAGRLNGAEIAAQGMVPARRLPLQTLRADIDFRHRGSQHLTA